jgi:hypothetical protein
LGAGAAGGGAIQDKGVVMSEQKLILHLRALLLDLISGVRPVDQAALDVLSGPQWSLLMAMVQQHRVGPLLHWQLLSRHSALQVPEAVRSALSQNYAQSALRNLQVQREMVLTHRILDAAGLAPVALKGAYLAWQVYPHPALRPLRDLDVLVPMKDGLRAYQALLDAGMSRIQKYGYEGDLDAVMGLAQHLPPLRSASGQLNIELHTRIFHVDEEHRGHEDLSDDVAFWSRASYVDLAGERIRFESPTDLLLHLIVHAVYDHEFTNGPLVLSDLAFLLQSHQIDWPLFWSLAKRFEYVQGCRIMLKLTSSYWGSLLVDWCGNEAELFDAELEQMALLLLRDFDLRKEVMLSTKFLERKSVTDKLRYVMSRIFVSKERMASLFPVRQDDWRIYFYYPIRWIKLVLGRFERKRSEQLEDVIAMDVELLFQLRKQLQV